MNDKPLPDSRVTRPIQAAILETLLLKDDTRDWPSLATAWAYEMYHNWCPWLRESFSSTSWFNTYYNRVISGRRPPPFPDDFKMAGREEALLLVILRTLLWVEKDDPERAETARRLITEKLGGFGNLEREKRGLSDRTFALVKEVGDVAEAVRSAGDPESPGGIGISPEEARRIVAELDEAQAAITAARAEAKRLSNDE